MKEKIGRTNRRAGRVLAFLITGVLLFWGVAWQSAGAQQSALADLAINVVAQRTGAPVSSLQVVAATRLGETGIARFKVLNKQNRTI